MSDETPIGFKLDRKLQREILLLLRTNYPHEVLKAYAIIGVEFDIFVPNILYLEEHGLCQSGIRQTMNNHYSMSGARILASGLDFLEGDGGLTAILGVVTVKLHADTVRDLMIAKVNASDLPIEKKTGLLAGIRKMSGTALTSATGDLVKLGLEHAPDGVHWIERLAGLVG